MTRDYYKGKHKYVKVGSDCVLYHAYWDGTAIDHSIYGHDGTVVGGGYVENGVHLDGVDDYIDCTNLTEIDGINKMTIFEWAYNTRDSANEVHIIRDGSFYLTNYLGGPFITFYRYSGGAIYNKVGTMPEDAWQLYTIVYDGTQPSGSMITIYLNNVDQSFALASGSDAITLGDGSGSLFIGCYLGNILNAHITVGEFLIFTDVVDRTAYYNATKARYGL